MIQSFKYDAHYMQNIIYNVVKNSETVYNLSLKKL